MVPSGSRRECETGPGTVGGTASQIRLMTEYGKLLGELAYVIAPFVASARALI
jgi:hypothetical protein